MRDLIRLVQDIAGGTLEGVVDEYPNKKEEATSVSFTVGTINGKLGADFSKEEIEGVLNRLGLSYVKEGSAFTVTSPWERRDIVLPEDLVEEIGRILGYDRVPATELPPAESTPDLARYRGIERIKDLLTERGFTEISTPSFASKGEIMLSNPLQSEKPYLRANLAGNMQDALERALNVAPRVLGPMPDVRLFELGTVFTSKGESLSLALGYLPLIGKKHPVLEEVANVLSSLLGVSLSVNGPTLSTLELMLGEADLLKLGAGYEPVDVALEKYREFSLFPFALRDVAVWTPSGTEESEVIAVILKEAGEHVARIDLFDRFEKEGRTSYAFRLVFESFTKTLSDEELVPAMERVTVALNAKDGWQVR
jgi:phenylalanyl-tRNA synthetase beta chain